MQEKELAKILEQYNDYLDAITGLDEDCGIEIELHKFRKSLRAEAVDWSAKEVFYSIEAKVFLKYLELCKNN